MPPDGFSVETFINQIRTMKTHEPIIAPRPLIQADKVQHYISWFGRCADDKYEEAALEQLDDAWQCVDNAVDVFITLCARDVAEELLSFVSLPHRCDVINEQARRCNYPESTCRRVEKVTSEIVWLAQQRDRILAECALGSPCLWQLTELAVRCRDTHKSLHYLLCETFPDFGEFCKTAHEPARANSD
jgi:hypothetical protein